MLRRGSASALWRLVRQSRAQVERHCRHRARPVLRAIVCRSTPPRLSQPSVLVRRVDIGRLWQSFAKSSTSIALVCTGLFSRNIPLSLSLFAFASRATFRSNFGGVWVLAWTVGNHTMGPKVDPIWEHYKVVTDHPSKASMDRLQCNYCQTTTCRNTQRAKKHITNCVGAIPDEVRSRYAEEVAEHQKLEATKERPPKRLGIIC